MIKQIIYNCIGILGVSILFSACKTPNLVEKTVNTPVPASYNTSLDTINVAKVQWKNYFKDPNLNALIDIALKNNQELNITLQEIEIYKNEIRAKKGEYLPFVNLGASSEIEKVGRYTREGSNDANTDIKPGLATPENLQNHMFSAYATWEIDIWKKLRNAKKAAVTRYLSSVEGKNFMVTHLVAEIANSYNELLALDNQLEILKQNIEIQNNALEIVKLQKQATRVTELAVRRFEAQVLRTKSLQYEIQQRIVETENKINFLLGRYPQSFTRSSLAFINVIPDIISSGVPSQLLENRTDIKQAELNLMAAKLDVKVAKANFYPSLRITAGLGYAAFNPSYLIQTPTSLLYNLAGDLTAPLINRNAIKATYYNANAKQVQAIYNYERTVLNAYVEVINQLSKINNLEKGFDFKKKEVEALTESIEISNNLFRSARADYMEVLLTQRDALESKFELIDTKMQLLNANINVYKALGGGWK